MSTPLRVRVRACVCSGRRAFRRGAFRRAFRRGVPGLSALLLVALSVLVLPAAAARAAGQPIAAPLPDSAKPGATTTIAGSEWPPSTLLTVLICGQNAVAGTDDCANASGRAVTTDADGRFTQQLDVQLPPKPCPCVVHVSTVTGQPVTLDVPFVVIGAPVQAIPPGAAGSGQLVPLNASMSGDSGMLNWFGAPPDRTFKEIVANMGAAPIVNPEFKLGTWHGVLAPEWSAAPWQGVIKPGQKVEIDLPVQFASGANGRYYVELRYQGRTLATQSENLPVAWGVYLFWVLLALVVAVGLFRIGLAILDKVRPDVSARQRERRRARLGRRRAGDPLPEASEASDPASDSAMASASGEPQPWAPRMPMPPWAPGMAPPQDARPAVGALPVLVATSEAATQALALPPIPGYAPTVRPEPGRPAAAVSRLPWFAPGTVPVPPQGPRSPAGPAASAADRTDPGDPTTAPPRPAPLVPPPPAERLTES